MGVNRQSSKKVIIGYSIVSPLHLINFLTYLRYTNNHYDIVYIFLGIYWSKNILPKRYLEYCSKKGYILVYEENEKNKILKQINSATLVFVKYLSWKIMLKEKNKIDSVVVIDEGLSSYAGFFHSIKAQARESKSILKTLKFILSWYLGLMVKMLYLKSYVKFTAFDIKKIEIISSYKENFSLVLNDLKVKNNLEDIDNVIIFCTQPWVDLGVMSCKQYTEYLFEIKDKLKRKDLNLVIKKHPADMIFDYSGFSVIEFDGAVEELVYGENCLGVLSACSTSSLLIPACLGINSYTTETAFLGGLDHRVKKLFQKYSKNIEQLF